MAQKQTKKPDGINRTIWFQEMFRFCFDQHNNILSIKKTNKQNQLLKYYKNTSIIQWI